MATRAVCAGARGLVGAMAMTGARRVTTGLGLLDRTPPEEILSTEVPQLLRGLSPSDEQAVVEVAHWAYGVAAGATFAALPTALRRSRLAGPLYGVVVWLTFELGIAPVLGIRGPRRRSASDHLSLLADHVLYGVVVADQLPGRRR